jgi:prepilin-type processing-associated H-X9-DG protein
MIVDYEAAPVRIKRVSGGVTILELLVVIATLAALTSLLFPAIQAARETTRDAQCLNNLHQIDDALYLYHDSYRTLPAGWQPEPTNKSSYGWAASILKEIGESGLGSRLDHHVPIDLAEPSLRSVTPNTLLCPSDPGEIVFPLYTEIGPDGLRAQDSSQVLSMLPRTNYVGVYGNTDPDDAPGELGTGIFIKGKGRRFAEVTRGLSQVVLVGERTTRKLPSSWLGTFTEGEDAVGRVVGFLYLGPNQSASDECELDSRHPGHANFAWADGRVSRIADDIDQNVYQQFGEIR